MEEIKNCKLLYIGRNTNSQLGYGGNIVRKIHELVLSDLFGNNIYKYLLPYKNNLWKKIYYKLFFMYFPGTTWFVFKNISNKIKKVKPDIVFIESSQEGSIAKYIKKHFSVIVITFFHNIELQYAKSYLSLFNIGSWLFYLKAVINESRAVKYSNKCIVLNKRDQEWLFKLYKCKTDILLPISMKNAIDYKITDLIKNINHLIHKHICIFVGANFWANTNGLKWFIKNVLPEVNIQLLIIGNGMTKSFHDTDKITVKDYVDDLTEYYLDADFVIEPIFSGGGMKTKTAEALMYGKSIIGTDEAFCGYEIDNIHGLYICNTKEEMIDKINNIYNENIYYFNENIHTLFLEKYSYDTTIKALYEIFNGIC